MWNVSKAETGLATWTVGSQSIEVDARGGGHGIKLTVQQAAIVSFCPIDEDKLPEACEQYVRGSGWHVNYSQGDSSYALRLSFEPIETTDERSVMEVCVSIQTDLLDLHPKLDIEVDCDDIDSVVPHCDFGDDAVRGSGVAPISIAKRSSSSASILLGPHDHPFTTNHSTDMTLRLRLFGDFLEKGVIRKARPWIVFDCGKTADEETVQRTWKELSDSPLPLTP
ncbi:hypothetical protein LF1_16800 [Rubripirellula obstinata]|uniref:Uncharacterized protein n=1 Tax=Rubripirellula obstinata TaxID=406547 RepID=A0A5B1CG39_9BACT|nr:hypothetical protein [Rubripirellula obstinata]KAA1259152.1 hypothetical protein LF1_16800 [Rubripirellula obstinata]